MILGHLPGLQEDALFFLLRMDSTALFVILHCRLLRTTITIPSLVSHVQESPDWVCFSDAQFPPFVQRSSEPHGRAVGTTLLILSARKTIDPWSTVGCRQHRNIRERRQASRRRLLSIGSDG